MKYLHTLKIALDTSEVVGYAICLDFKTRPFRKCLLTLMVKIFKKGDKESRLQKGPMVVGDDTEGMIKAIEHEMESVFCKGESS